MRPALITRTHPATSSPPHDLQPFSCSVNGRFLDVPDPNPLILEQGKSECHQGRRAGVLLPQTGLALIHQSSSEHQPRGAHCSWALMCLELPGSCLAPLTSNPLCPPPCLPAVIQWTNFTGLFLHPLHLHSGTMTVSIL